ncbi:hypothetical protein [Streptomyces sp. NBC_00687]|uniref:hypothetical protein n=1 Tax=Streptomyces sp. NBC_00687 TaxID=2975807 RepID=UPI00224F3B20|nr:hypothetical protein [Streptomyces sp. NBC_00687]MCX4912005.1 hypothetical protein [Streptomyces sp. NBC_00687]
MPDDARGLVYSGRADRHLFDITTLSTPLYAQHQDLGLIVMNDLPRRGARTAIRSLAGAAVEHTLASVNAAAVTVLVDGSAQLRSTRTRGPTGATSRAVAPGIASVWLGSEVQASLAGSVPQIGTPEAGLLPATSRPPGSPAGR